MSTETDTKTPESMLEQLQGKDKNVGYNLLRVYTVRNGKRGPWKMDLEPSELAHIRPKLASTVGAGDWDLELAVSGKNIKGPQCRVELDVDLRSPAQQQQASNGPTHVYAQPMGQQQSSPWGPTMYPTIVQAQPASGEISSLREMVIRLEARLAATPQNQSAADSFMQTLFRDMMLERHKAGNAFLMEQKSTWEQAFAFGQKIKGHGGGASDSWSNPSAVAPLLKSAADALKTLFAGQAAASAQASPNAQAPPDKTAMLVAFVKASVESKVQPKAALAQLRAMMGDDAVKSLVEQRLQFLEYFISLDEMKPMVADAYARKWLEEAAAELDAIAGVPPAAPAVEADEVIPAPVST